MTNLRGAVAAHKRSMTNENGLDFSKLTDDQLTADYHYNVFPNITLIFSASRCGCFAIARIRLTLTRCISIA